MSFDVDIGFASEAGHRDFNEDCAGVLRPPPHDEGRGLLAVIADGVSAGGLGREAARTAVASLVEDFHAVPSTWDITVALDRLIGAHNTWLFDHNQRRSRAGGETGLTTLTALVLQGHTWTVAHVGDTRAWLLRAGDCTQLTQDHALDHPDLRHSLVRAIGLDDSVRVDFFQGDLQAGDVIVLTSDGVHQALKASRLAELAGQGGAQDACHALVRAALDAGSRDNVTAVVIRVRGLASGRLEDVLRQGRQLPVPPRLKVGDVLDGFAVTTVVADTGVHRLYQARDLKTQELVALKTLNIARASDAQERSMLAHEAWLGLRMGEFGAQGFVRVRDVPEPSAFYVVFDWHHGATLEQALAEGRRFSAAEVVRGALSVSRALGRLHRQGVIHRDVKPENLHFAEGDGQWRLLDLGVALSGREPVSSRELHAGTPSYMNPEQWLVEGEERAADSASDLYALGVTLYRWLTGRLPYGEIEPYQTGAFRRDPVAPSRLRPDVPIWLDHVVLKAVARDRKQRFETAEELVLALERGASRPLAAPPATPLVTRDPAALWKIALAVSIGFNLLLIVWLFFLPR